MQQHMFKLRLQGQPMNTKLLECSTLAVWQLEGSKGPVVRMAKNAHAPAKKRKRDDETIDVILPQLWLSCH